MCNYGNFYVHCDMPNKKFNYTLKDEFLESILKPLSQVTYGPTECTHPLNAPPFPYKIAIFELPQHNHH